MLAHAVLQRLGSHLSYANIMATIAVFVALGGTGYAALRITGKNVKNSSLTGADVRNSSLTGRDVRNRSLLRRDFKAGQLPRGAKGDTGPPGPYLEVLPSGKSLRGTYAASGTAAAGGVVVRDAPSFAFPLPSAWTSHVILDGAAAPAECPGNVDAPEALPGHLCVYEGFGNNRVLLTDAPAGTGSESFGWIAQITAVAAGSFQSRGTWAVTAP
jgi:hypothetical protein